MCDPHMRIVRRRCRRWWDKMNRIMKWWRWLNQTEWRPSPVEIPIVTYELPPEEPAKLESHIEQVESLLKRLEEQCQQK